MNEPIVSVVIRAFNSEKYIGQAIQSILNQTFQDFEIIVVNDASTDTTPSILQAFGQADERIKIITNNPNQGPVKTINIGLKHACGEFVAIQDADDLSLPRRLETQVNFFKNNLSIALIGGGSFQIDEEGEVCKVVTRERRYTKEFRQDLEELHTMTHSSVMFRRACIEALGLYDEFFLYAHDYDMLIRMADRFEVLYYEEPLVERRLLNSGITGTKKQAQAAFAELARKRSKANREGLILDLQQEYEYLIDSNAIMNGRFRNRAISDTVYYYSIGKMLLKMGKPKQARKRFWRALQQRSNMALSARAFIFCIISSLPNLILSKIIRS